MHSDDPIDTLFKEVEEEDVPGEQPLSEEIINCIKKSNNTTRLIRNLKDAQISNVSPFRLKFIKALNLISADNTLKKEFGNFYKFKTSEEHIDETFTVLDSNDTLIIRENGDLVFFINSVLDDPKEES
jgi:patatin-like phospholipase/acyl hydrolase